MESTGEKFSVVLKIPNAEVFFVNEGQTNLVASGVLSVAEIPQNQSYAILLDDFNYLISSEIPVMGKKTSCGESLYILPNTKGYFGLKLPSNTQTSLVDIFDVIIQQTSELILEVEQAPVVSPVIEQKASSGFVLKKSADYNPNITKNPVVIKEATIEKKEVRPQIVREKEKVKTAGSESSPENAKVKSKEKGEDNTTIASNTIVKGGVFVRDGLIKVAEVTSVGIVSAGKYLSRRFMKKNKDVEVKSETMTQLKVAKTTTKAVATFTALQIKALIGAAAMIGKEVASQFENSETGKKLQDKPVYEGAKKIGASAVQATASVYDGMFEALCTLGKGIGNATTDALTYKYGEKMGNAAQEVLEGVGNVGLVMKALPAGTAKALSGNNNEVKK